VEEVKDEDEEKKKGSTAHARGFPLGKKFQNCLASRRSFLMKRKHESKQNPPPPLSGSSYKTQRHDRCNS
jgi:hypothetical protein